MAILAPALGMISSFAAGAGGTASALGTALSVGGTLLTGFMGFRQAQAESANQKAQAKLEIAQSQENARRQRQQNERLRGEQVAKLGTAGVEFLGSPLDFITDDTELGELTARDIEQRGAANAAGLRYGAKQSMTRGYSSLIGSGLKAGAKVVDAWDKRPVLTAAPGGSKG